MNSLQRQDNGGYVEISRFKLWFGLLGGAGAWLAHLMIAYTIAEFGCLYSGHYYFLGITLIAWLLVALSGLTLLIAIVAAILAYRIQARLADASELSDAMSGAVYAAKAGWITSALFALVIAVESLPIFYYLSDC